MNGKLETLCLSCLSLSDSLVRSRAHSESARPHSGVAHPFGALRRTTAIPLLCRTVAVSSQLLHGARASVCAMKALAFALVLSLSLLGAERARAADLPLPGGAPIPPSSYYPVSPPINWGGVYIGLNGGYGLGSSNWSNSLGSTGNFPVNGGVFGGTLGINYAGFGDWVLLGFEGDFDWSGATGSGGCSVLDAGLQENR